MNPNLTQLYVIFFTWLSKEAFRLDLKWFEGFDFQVDYQVISSNFPFNIYSFGLYSFC